MDKQSARILVGFVEADPYFSYIEKKKKRNLREILESVEIPGIYVSGRFIPKTEELSIDLPANNFSVNNDGREMTFSFGKLLINQNMRECRIDFEQRFGDFLTRAGNCIEIVVKSIFGNFRNLPAFSPDYKFFLRGLCYDRKISEQIKNSDFPFSLLGAYRILLSSNGKIRLFSECPVLFSSNVSYARVSIWGDTYGKLYSRRRIID